MNELAPENRERLTFDEIDERYRGQWTGVVITKIEDNTPVEGVVLVHDEDSAQAAEKFRPYIERLNATGERHFFSFTKAGIFKEKPPAPND